MKLKYVIYCQHYTEESIEVGEAESIEEVENSEMSVAELARHVRRNYDICAGDVHSRWWESVTPPLDREYLEQGITKFYSLHILYPKLSAKNHTRFNNMLKAAR